LIKDCHRAIKFCRALGKSDELFARSASAVDHRLHEQRSQWLSQQQFAQFPQGGTDSYGRQENLI
jgi:hypothetical protein